MTTLNVNGITLAYETFGAAEAAPLVLIEGMGAQMIGWRREFCEALAKSGHYVVRFDNRDVGRSSWSNGTRYELGDMADDAAGLIRTLRLAPAHIVGQSMGGMIAQELAIHHPDAVRSLCLIYTAPSLSYATMTPGYRVARTAPASTREEAIEQFVENERWCSSAGYPFEEDWIRALAAASYDRGYNPEGIDRQLHAAEAAGDRSEALAALDVPTIVLHGDADRLIDVSGGRALAEAIPGAELYVFPGMGHELPRALWPTFVEFIAGNAARARVALSEG